MAGLTLLVFDGAFGTFFGDQFLGKSRPGMAELLRRWACFERLCAGAAHCELMASDLS